MKGRNSSADLIANGVTLYHCGPTNDGVTVPSHHRRSDLGIANSLQRCVVPLDDDIGCLPEQRNPREGKARDREGNDRFTPIAPAGGCAVLHVQNLPYETPCLSHGSRLLEKTGAAIRRA